MNENTSAVEKENLNFFKRINEPVSWLINENETQLTRGDATIIVHYSQDLIFEGIDKFRSGEGIMQSFPFFTEDEREFLITGLLPEEWNALVSDEDEDEEF